MMQMMQMMKKAFFGALFSCFYLYISEKSSKFAGSLGAEMNNINTPISRKALKISAMRMGGVKLTSVFFAF